MKLFNILLLALSCFILSSCHDDEPLEDVVQPPQGNVSATYTIQVTDQNGAGINGASVNLSGIAGTTNDAGLCQLTSTTFPAGLAPIKITGLGYFQHAGVVNVVAGRQTATVRLTPIVVAGSFSATSGGTVALAGGGSVVFSANSVENTNGTPYNGTVNVAANYIEPTSALARQLLPNSFLGKNAAGAQQFLENHGTVVVELSNGAGQALQLASGTTATINMPVAAHDMGSAAATMPLYYFEPTTGLWQEEGMATLNGNMYSGTVGHFTFWMCPAIYDHHWLIGTLQCQSSPLPASVVEVYNQWGAYLGSTTTDATGSFGGMIPNTLTFDLVVTDPCGATAFTQAIGPFSSNTDLGTIDACGGSANFSTITGSLTDCDGTSDASAYCRVQSNGFMQLLPVNGQGQVNASVLFCNGSSSVSVSGINLTNGLTSTDQSFTISPSIDFGTQSICATVDEFVQFNMDGTDHYFTENEFADFHATYTAAQNRLSLSVVGGVAMNETQFGVVIPGSTAATYSVGGNPFAYSFLTMGNNGTVNLSVTLTGAGAQLGDLIEGTVSNITFQDASGTDRVLQNCSFSIEVDLVQ